MLWFRECENFLEKYCIANGYNFSKLKTFPKGISKDRLEIYYHDPSKGHEGLKDETPMPVVLTVKKHNGEFSVLETEHTERLLS